MLRSSLKGLLHRKLRLILAVIAVMLGVGFVAGANVLTDSLSSGFDKLFATVNENVAVQVQPDDDAADGETEPPRLTAADVARLESVDGVAKVHGDVSAEGVVPFSVDTGKAVQTGGPPSLGIGIDPDELEDPASIVRLVDGSAPERDDEAVLTKRTANLAAASVGDTIKVYVPRLREAKEYRVVGVLQYTGDRDSLGGETMVGFTIEEGQRLFYGKEGVYSGASIVAEPEVADTALKRRVAADLPSGFTAKTGQEATDEQASEIKEGLGFINWFFLTFALVALLVGVFLIFNTFNIVVAQRSRELALYRAMGASRGQVTRTVLVEALVIGLVGSGLGLLFGAGLAMAAQGFFGAIGIDLPDGGVVVSVTTVLISLATGIGVTLVSALAPAIRASGVSPVAAMRDVVKPDKPLRWLLLSGLLLAVPGVALIAWALTGIGGATLPVLGLGVVAVFVGVALLSPVLTRPLSGLVGGLLSWGAASKLGRRNALRNPRRTAVTAAALMIGVTLVSAFTVLGASFKATVTELFNDQRGADVIINTTNMQGPPDGRLGFDPDKLNEVRDIDGVEKAAPLHVSLAKVDGSDSYVSATDLASAKSMFAMTVESGRVGDLADDEAAVDKRTAKDNGWKVGDAIAVQPAGGGERTYRIVGVYDSELGMNGVLLDSAAAKLFAGDLANQGYVKLSDDADSDAVVKQVESILADYPMVTVADRSDMVEQVNSQIDIALNIFRVLLALAVFIAFLGIVNTLLLSIYERTRELGMLRAIGMARKQVKRMIRVESVIIAVFGCALGIGLGLALGVAVGNALIDQGQMTTIALPGVDLIAFVAVAVVAGVAAAWWPAFRASRLNVLEAIAYE